MTTLETSNNSPRTAFNAAAPQGFVGAALGRVLAELEPPGAAPKTPPGEPNVFDLGSLGAQEAAIKQANAQGDMGPQSFTFGGAAAKRQEEALAAKEKRDKEHKEQMFQQLLERLREQSARLGGEIANLESGFEQKYGDAWREHMANQILDPDVIPQRENGESITEYRERLEKTLIEEMINEDGTIKDEYKTGEYAQWAVWAQKEKLKEKTDNFIERRSDPNVTPEEHERETKEFTQTAAFDELWLTQSTETKEKMAHQPQTTAALSEEADKRVDELKLNSTMSDDMGFASGP